MGRGMFSVVEHRRKLREERLSKGLCVECGKNKISNNSISRCDECNKKARDKHHRNKFKTKK